MPKEKCSVNKTFQCKRPRELSHNLPSVALQILPLPYYRIPAPTGFHHCDVDHIYQVKSSVILFHNRPLEDFSQLCRNSQPGIFYHYLIFNIVQTYNYYISSKHSIQISLFYSGRLLPLYSTFQRLHPSPRIPPINQCQHTWTGMCSNNRTNICFEDLCFREALLNSSL